MQTHIFQSPDTFGALYAAEAWCKENGFSFGSTDVTGYVALKRGEWAIAKWKNLTAKERAQCDGIMSGDWRNGPITVSIKD